MKTEIIVAYCISDDIVKSLGIREDRQIRMSTGEVMTTAVVAALFFQDNHNKARIFLREHNYIPHMLSKSQFSRRLYAISRNVWEYALSILSRVFIKK